MSKFYDKAVALREDTNVHYNCAQAVLMPFAEDTGLSEAVAKNISSNFGSGMKRAATCGAVTGGLMVLGLYGVEDPGVIGEYHRRIKANHEGVLDCATLLKKNQEQGRAKKPHCDDMVYECVKIAEDLLRELGKIQ